MVSDCRRGAGQPIPDKWDNLSYPDVTFQWHDISSFAHRAHPKPACFFNQSVVKSHQSMFVCRMDSDSKWFELWKQGLTVPRASRCRG